MIDEKRFNYALASLDKAGQHQKATKDKSYYYGMLTMLQIIVSDGWKMMFLCVGVIAVRTTFSTKPPKGVFKGVHA